LAFVPAVVEAVGAVVTAVLPPVDIARSVTFSVLLLVVVPTDVNRTFVSVITELVVKPSSVPDQAAVRAPEAAVVFPAELCNYRYKSTIYVCRYYYE
jgi:hypothetical protein